MNDPIPFPAPAVEHYPIDYDPVTHRVDIPLIPDNSDDGACVLAVLIAQLISEGTMTEDQVLQTVLQAVGDL